MNDDRIAALRDMVQPIDARWLNLAPEYHFRGVARFAPRVAEAEGPVVARYDELGHERVVMQVEQVVIDGIRHAARDGHLFNVQHTVDEPNEHGVRGHNLFANECHEIDTIPEMEATVSYCSTQKWPIMVGSDGTELTLMPNRAVATFSTKPIRYWVAPLAGFISDFPAGNPALDNHPLRLRRPMAMPELDDERERLAAEHLRDQHNRIISFECGGHVGFIEPLPDYAERATRIKSAPSDQCVSAVMIGRFAKDIADPMDELAALPDGALEAIRLATGRGITAPWLELRDEHGDLVARVHMRHDVGRGEWGSPIIYESHNRSTGLLISKMIASPLSESSDFLVAVKRLAGGAARDQTLEDQMGQLHRAAEGICRFLGQNPQDLEDLPLDTALRDEAIAVLERAATELDAVATTAIGKEQREFIGRLAKRVRDQRRIRVGTGKQLVALLSRYQLEDAEALPNFRVRIKKDARLERWPAVVDLYRNKVAHGDYLQVDRYDIHVAFAYVHHLQDVLLRIVFSAIDFDGYYEPPCLYARSHETRRWVKADRTTPGRLRYTDHQ